MKNDPVNVQEGTEVHSIKVIWQNKTKYKKWQSLPFRRFFCWYAESPHVSSHHGLFAKVFLDSWSPTPLSSICPHVPSFLHFPLSFSYSTHFCCLPILITLPKENFLSKTTLRCLTYSIVFVNSLSLSTSTAHMYAHVCNTCYEWNGGKTWHVLLLAIRVPWKKTLLIKRITKATFPRTEALCPRARCLSQLQTVSKAVNAELGTRGRRDMYTATQGEGVQQPFNRVSGTGQE